MDRLTRRAFLAALAWVIVAAAATIILGGSGGLGPTATAGPGSLAAATPPGDALTADGVVIKIESTGLSSVQAFTLLTSDGQALRFTLVGLVDGVAFPPGHLVVHEATAARIRVWYRETAAGLDAVWLEDLSGMQMAPGTTMAPGSS